MELTQAQYERIAHLFPKQRGNVSLSHLTVLNAILYVVEHGGKWWGLPPHVGNWHTLTICMSRWAKSGVLERVFVALQQQALIRVKGAVLSLDSTAMTVHPDGTGGLKKRSSGYRQITWGLDHQTASGCRGCR